MAARNKTSMKQSLIIGSRASKLAIWQAESVKGKLNDLYPDIAISIQTITTTGDVQLNAPLKTIGGKGVFTKEIEEALLAGKVDLAVHSLKDLPTVLPARLTLAAIMEREDVRDAFVLRSSGRVCSMLETFPPDGVVGTSSQRRAAQMRRLRPNVIIKDLRGNIHTRLDKLDRGDFDAIILASAGLKRLGLSDRISTSIRPQQMLPAIGQGALAVEVRSDDPETAQIVGSLDHPATRLACIAERSFLKTLGGGCELPIAGYAVVLGDDLQLEGLVIHPSGDPMIRQRTQGRATQASELGESLARALIDLGGLELLEA